MTPASCPACGQPTIAGKRFCADCGAALPLLCAACGQPLVPGKRFCADCGAPVPDTVDTPSVERAAPLPDLHGQFAAFQQALPPSMRQQVFTQEEGENRLRYCQLRLQVLQQCGNLVLSCQSAGRYPICLAIYRVTDVLVRQHALQKRELS